MNKTKRAVADIGCSNHFSLNIASWVALILQTAVALSPLAPASFALAAEQRVAAKENDRSALPRVLIIGDSIAIGYTPATRELLKDKADLHLIPVNGQATPYGLQHLDEWIGNDKWDVIHFNWGMWDICYRNPEAKTQGHRDKVHGKLTTSPEEYEKNLRALVVRLKATGAKLIWATTTPVPDGEIGRVKGDETKYNAIAAKIMKENGIAIDDLNSDVTPKLAELQLPNGDVHFTVEGYRYLAAKVAESIMSGR